MATITFKRKIYDRLLQWKKERNGQTAVLIQGARRVGKSTIVEEFAKHEYTSYILIDFNKAPKKIKDLFDDLDNLDYIFLTLQAHQQDDISTVEECRTIKTDEVCSSQVRESSLRPNRPSTT